MEERVLLPFMTAQEEEVYRRYYGEHNLPPRQNLHVQYASVRRPSYPPAQTTNIQDNHHYGETSERVGGLGLAYVSTPNFDSSLRPPSPNIITIPDHVRICSDDYSNAKEIVDESFYRQHPASPNTVTIPNHVRLSNDGYSNAKEIADESFYRQRPASPYAIIPNHVRPSNDGYSNPRPMPSQQANVVTQQQPASPNTITIPNHVRLSHDDYTGPRPIHKEPEQELVTFQQRLMGRTKYASRGDKPSTMRHFLRSLQFLSAALVLILAILTNMTFPRSLANQATIVYFHVVSSIDLVLFIFHTVDYCQRRFSYRAKLWRVVPLTLDAAMTLLWVCGTLPLLTQFDPCPIGGYAGWCNRRNSLLAFATLSSGLAFLSLTWDLFGTCLKSRPPPKPQQPKA